MHAAIPATLILTSLGFHVTHHKTIIIVAPTSAAQVLSTNPLQNLLLPAWNEVQNNLLSNKSICVDTHLQIESGYVKNDLKLDN